MLKAYKYRIYPNTTQAIMLNKHFGCVRFVWNKFVETFNKKEKIPSIKEFRSVDDYWFLKEVSAGALQQKERDFKEFKTQLFSKTRKKKVGFPKFKKRGIKDSYRLPNQKFYIVDNKIWLEKIGRVKIVLDRELIGKQLSVTISKDKTDCYYVSIVCELEIQPKEKTNKFVGIDLGIKQLITSSDGLQVKMFTDNQSKQKHMQKILSRKIKGSSRYNKVKLRLSKIHKKTEARRTWLLHNITSYLVDSYDKIVVENLNVKGMVRNHKLARSIHNQAWSQLVSQLEYKCNWYGKELIKIDRFFPSSKLCSCCGQIKSDLTLSDRTYICDCGLNKDRDLNASLNILAEGVDSAQRSSRECQTSIGLPIKAIPVEMINFL